MHGINPRCRLVLLFCFFLHACAPAAASAPPGDGSSAEAPSSAEEVEAVDALAFFVLALLLGIFSTHLLSWTRVPYTAMLLVGTPSLRNSALLQVASACTGAPACPQRQRIMLVCRCGASWSASATRQARRTGRCWAQAFACGR